MIKGYEFVFEVIKSVIIMPAQNDREEIQGVLEMVKYESIFVIRKDRYLQTFVNTFSDLKKKNP